MPKLILTVGLPASGKSSYARGRVSKDKKLIRFNNDDMAKMMYEGQQREGKAFGIVINLLKAGVEEALKQGFDVIVDNTNLNPKTRTSWELVAQNHKAAFELVDFTKVSIDDCIKRDALRQNGEQVTAPVIWTMALHAGLMKFDSRQIIIVDVDGTLANCDGIRSPYDESLVHLDTTHDVICEWVRNLVYQEGHPFHIEYQVIIVSGRSTLCASSTHKWLVGNNIPHSAVFMRNRGDRRPDTTVKQEILDGILYCGAPKEQIAFVIDDRPSVIEMWKANGLTVYPARGKVESF